MRLPDEAKVAGPCSGPESQGLAEAIWAHRYAKRRRPDERDIPPPSIFPFTRAAREALRLSRYQ